MSTINRKRKHGNAILGDMGGAFGQTFCGTPELLSVTFYSFKSQVKSFFQPSQVIVVSQVKPQINFLQVKSQVTFLQVRVM